jgi:hypothetical protein
MSSILEKYNSRADEINSLLCVGLDSELEKLPMTLAAASNPQFEFNKNIIEQTHEFTSSYKLNIAFYESRGEPGIEELKMTVEYLKQNHPDIMVICDAKRADIGNTNRGYVHAIFDDMGFDAFCAISLAFNRAASTSFSLIVTGIVAACTRSRFVSSTSTFGNISPKNRAPGITVVMYSKNKISHPIIIPKSHTNICSEKKYGRWLFPAWGIK